MVPGTSPVRVRGPVTSRGVPAALQMIPGFYPAPAQGPSGSPNGPWNLPSVHMGPSCQSTHWAQQPLAGSQRLVKWFLAPPQCTHRDCDPTRGPSCSSNDPWHLTRTRPNHPWHLPSTRMGPSDFAWGSSGSPNDPWHLPSMRTGPSDLMQGPRGSPNGPWHIPRAHEPQRLHAGSQRLAQLYLAPPRLRSGSQRLAKRSLAPPQRTNRDQQHCVVSQQLAK
ncbi:UNVERIFIED_CONTAM: hypothetical protein FKN15_017559 [Acipenser sinensis]